MIVLFRNECVDNNNLYFIQEDFGVPEWWEDAPELDVEAAEPADEADKYTPLVRLYALFLLMFQSLFRLSDTALSVLLKFLAMFFRSLGRMVGSLPGSFLDSIPDNIGSARKNTGSARDRFVRFVCCPSCHALYSMDECVPCSRNCQLLESKKCSFVRFPSHPQPQHRKACGTPLMKKVKTVKGATFQPRLVYCYKSIIESLQEMLKQPGFIEKCELWRKRDQNPGTFKDVYDGQVWKDFWNYKGIPFLAIPNNYAFQLNVDWFNPFKHTQHSEGAIYLSILNLPRNERFLQQNIILVGVIPGPKEPSLTMNSFLKPLVSDFLKLWQGVVMKNPHSCPILVRGALLCCSSDIPANRKLCGFVGYSALKGCSKCLLSFPTPSFGEKSDYSNFDRTQWEPRSISQHRSVAQEYGACNTQASQKEIEHKFGIRYSALLELPYFDAVVMCVIDPMHNLLLGTGKHMIEMWKKSGILTSNDFALIQEKVDSFIAPSDIGRLPLKISSGFSGFTADQWKNWIIFYSLFALKDALPWKHYNCWHYFVKICYLLCRRTITQEQLHECDLLIDTFCTTFVHLYGADHCTINMHLHGHLPDCVRDYGPVYSFWCFAFERMNGILGDYHTNNHHISVQIMRRFLDSKAYSPVYWPNEYVSEYLSVLRPFAYNKGSLMQTTLEAELSAQGTIKALPTVKEHVLSQSQMQEVKLIFGEILDSQAFEVLMICHLTKSLRVGDFVLGAVGSRNTQSSLVLAECSPHQVVLAEVQYFLEVTVKDNDHQNLWVACVNTFMEHPCRVWFGNPVQVWTSTISSSFHLIPVNRIRSRVAYVKCKHDFGRVLVNDNVFVVVPIGDLSNCHW